MIIGYVKGQQFKASQPVIVSETVNYLDARIIFQTAEWADLIKIAHFKGHDGTDHPFLLNGDTLPAEAELNLSAGKWTVFVSGQNADGTKKVTTTSATVNVVQYDGSSSLPEIGPDLADQILGRADEALKIAKNVQAGEDGRVEAEDSRVKAEASRNTAESQRKTAETGRVEAEAGRVSAENARQAAESEREKLDQTRRESQMQWEAFSAQAKKDEAARTAAEQDRESAESNRKSAETARGQWESGRQRAESTRESAESGRKLSEQGRKTAETARKSAEDSRAKEERGRKAAEGGRESAETAREDSEGKRTAAENGRVSAEQGRVSAESGRQAAEKKREEAEQKRETVLESYESYASETFSNSLKGKASGLVIAVDDASPVTHTVGCKLERINLLDSDSPGVCYPSEYAKYYKTEGQGKGKIEFGGLSGDTTGGYVYVRPSGTNVSVRFNVKSDVKAILAKQFKHVNEANLMVSTKQLSSDSVSGGVYEKTFTLDPEYPYFGIGLQSTNRSSVVTECIISETDNPVEYVPYVSDLSAVTVTKCGANLISDARKNFVPSIKTGEDVRFDGAASSGYIPIDSKKTYFLKAGHGVEIYIMTYDADKKYLGGKIGTTSMDTTAVFAENPKAKFVRVRCDYFQNGSFFFSPFDAPFAEYAGGEYRADAEGSVSGVASSYPYMTILADNPGVTISAGYNRDINKLAETLIKRIAALEKALTEIKGGI